MGQSLAEKILQQHTEQEVKGPGQILQCSVSSVLANDITAPLAIEALEKMGAQKVFDREKVILVCDHFVPNKDIASAEQVKAVREFARKMDILHYYEGGDVGVEHALLPESGLVGPGDILVGADSHTCTYGALGAFATGLGSTDIAAAMALGSTWFKVPGSIKVEVDGPKKPYSGGKDLILYLIGQIGVDGAIYKSLQFEGPGVKQLSMDDRMTISNMAIECGAKAGLFAADEKTLVYLEEAGRTGDTEIHADADAEYEEVLAINLQDIDPQVACPHLPENVKPVQEVEGIKLDQVVIGSCTNGRISDMQVAAEILRGEKVAPGLRLIILPATPKVYAQCLQQGLLEIFLDAGAIIGPPTCGPCLGGHMGILAAGEKCLSTTNRNFKGRMGSLASEVYLAGPATAASSAVAGQICHPARIKEK